MNKDDDDKLEDTPEEIEDLDAPEEEGEDVKGGKPKIFTGGCTSSGCVNG